jgi:hypothetical protein
VVFAERNHDDLPVFGQMNIEFSRIGLLFPGEPERRQGVLRCVVGCPAMCDDLHRIDLSGIERSENHHGIEDCG